MNVDVVDTTSADDTSVSVIKIPSYDDMFIKEVLSIILNHGIVFGGFVRDFMKQKSFNDIDVFVGTKARSEALITDLQFKFKVQYHIPEEEKYSFEVVKVVVTSLQSSCFCVTLDVARRRSIMKQDFDINQLLMTRIDYPHDVFNDGITTLSFHKCFGNDVCISTYSNLDLETIFNHIQTGYCIYLGDKTVNKFYPNYDYHCNQDVDDKDMIDKRIAKMKQNGWQIKNID